MNPPLSRSAGSALLAASALAISTLPALQFGNWPWVVLALAGAVTVWGAAPFHRRAWTAGRITLDTLISVAALAALGWSATRLGSGAVEPVPSTAAVAAAVVAVALAGEPAPRAGPAARAAAWYAPVVIALAVAAFGYWFGTGHAELAFTTAVTVLVVGCPGALPLAVAPVLGSTALGSTGLGSTGLAPEVAEPARRVDIAVLASPIPVDRMEVVPGVADQVLRLAGSVVERVTDPIAEAIALAGRERTGELPGVADFDSKPGAGWVGVVAELVATDRVVAHAVVVGSPDLLAGYGIALTAELDEAFAAAEAAGQRAVAVAWDGIARAVIALAAITAPEWVAAVADLRAAGLRPVLLSGDPSPVARAVGAAVGIPAGDVIAVDQVAEIRRWARPGRAIAVIGADGRDLDFGTDTGTDVISGPDPAAVVAAVQRSRRTFGVVRGNVAGALACHVVAAPAAAGGLVGPAAAGAAIGVGVLWVVGNSLRPRRGRATRPGYRRVR